MILKLQNILKLIKFGYLIWVIKWYHHFNIEQYIPYSLICDLFGRNFEKKYLNNIEFTVSQTNLLITYVGFFSFNW